MNPWMQYTPDQERNRIIEKALGADALLILIVSKPAAWHGYGLPQHLSDTIQHLTKATNPAPSFRWVILTS